MTGSRPQPDRKGDTTDMDTLLFDPRRGDAEDGASSPKLRSLLAIAGSLLVEIRLPKLVFARTVSILLLAVLLGSAPLVAMLKVSPTVAELTELGAVLMLLAIVGLEWMGWRPLLRTAEVNFWSLNALAVQPGYAFCREALRYLTKHLPDNGSTIVARVRLRAPLIWDFADASMDEPIDLASFDGASNGSTWCTAHLSDIHIVGERYGVRIESERSGPDGNDRIAKIMAGIEAIHSVRPPHLVLVGGRNR